MLNRRAFLCGFLSFAAAAGLPGGVAGAMAAGLKVMASSYPVWLLTRDVTARTPGLTPELLVAASAGCPHDYTLTPRDMLRLSSSSTLIINGRGFEAFLSSALDQLKKLSVIDAGGNIPALPEDDDHHDGSDHHEEHEHHHDHPHGNPHYFSSPARAAVMVKNIAEGLASLAPGEAAVLRATGSELEGRLNKLGEEVAKLGKSGSGVDFILQHDALSINVDQNVGSSQIDPYFFRKTHIPLLRYFRSLLSFYQFFFSFTTYKKFTQKLQRQHISKSPHIYCVNCCS